MLVFPTFPKISMIPETIAPLRGSLQIHGNEETLAKPTFPMICLVGIMENVGFTNISNNFHDC